MVDLFRSNENTNMKTEFVGDVMRASFYHHATTSAKMLTPVQQMIVQLCIDYPYLDTLTLSTIRDTSKAMAANQLSALYNKGYFTREEKPDPSGGYFYEYKCDPMQWGQ